MKLWELLALGKLTKPLPEKDKGFYFDKKGDLHITSIDYNNVNNQPNHAFPIGKNK
jgi:hypothetical protein